MSNIWGNVIFKIVTMLEDFMINLVVILFTRKILTGTAKSIG